MISDIRINRRLFSANYNQTIVAAYNTRLTWPPTNEYAIISRLVSLTKIVITGNKEGTGKTTITALLAEYLIYKKKS